MNRKKLKKLCHVSHLKFNFISLLGFVLILTIGFNFILKFFPICVHVHVNSNYHSAKNCLFMKLCVKIKTHANRTFRAIPLQIRWNWFSFFFIDFQGWNQQHEMQCTHDNFIQSKYPFECYAGNDTILAPAF